MWAIFLLSAFGFGAAAIGLVWVGNTVYNKMRRDDHQTQKEKIDEMHEKNLFKLQPMPGFSIVKC